MARLQNISLHCNAIARAARLGQWRKIPFYIAGIRRMLVICLAGSAQ